MRYFEAPQEYTTERKSIFLAGGITGCPDWQQEVARKLVDMDVALLNPRRKDFPIEDPAASEAQIKWEFTHLRQADAILFWFPKETLCPIVLYELGAWSMTKKPLFIGVEPGYKRAQDVEIQTKLARPELQIGSSLDTLCELIGAWLVSGNYAR
jgi:hypothetical protein